MLARRVHAPNDEGVHLEVGGHHMEGGAEHRLQGPSTRAVVDRDCDLAVGTNGPSNEVDDVREVFFGHLSEWDATHGLARKQVHTSRDLTFTALREIVKRET